MAGSKGRSSASDKAYYTRYNYEAQRKKRLERHLKKQPNDEQAKAALNNIHHRGPRPSNTEHGWIRHQNIDLGFYDTDKKKAVMLDKTNPKIIAWVKSIIKKAEKQHRHEQNYATKEERKKGGNVRK